MKSKAKGIKAERELIHMFWGSDWGALRVAGSGSSTYPAPDVLAGNQSRTLAIECKSSRKTEKYLTKEKIDQLLQFCKTFNAEPWIGIRFHNQPWYFISIEDATKKKESYFVSLDLAKKKGVLFDELIGF